MKSVLIAACFSFLIAGCATTFKPWQLNEVQEGMNRDQVVSALGEPDYTANQDGKEFLYYSYAKDLNPETTVGYGDKDIARKTKALSDSLITTKYEVVLVDGKLVSYKQLED